MIGLRRPNGVVRRSERAPMIGGTVIAKRPPRLTARPMAVPWLAFGTTSSIWLWTTTVVSGCQRKKLPNQKALRAAWRRLPNRAGAGGAAATVAMAVG